MKTKTLTILSILIFTIQMILPITSNAYQLEQQAKSETTMDVTLQRDETDRNKINVIATDTTYNITELKYVNKYIKCQICNQSMTVVRSFKGKVYLKCFSGDSDHNTFLTKDIVNSYIAHTNPTCPQCRGYIKKCGVSKFGLWVMCENGHYPKADEI